MGLPPTRPGGMVTEPAAAGSPAQPEAAGAGDGGGGGGAGPQPPPHHPARPQRQPQLPPALLTSTSEKSFL